MGIVTGIFWGVIIAILALGVVLAMSLWNWSKSPIGSDDWDQVRVGDWWIYMNNDPRQTVAVPDDHRVMVVESANHGTEAGQDSWVMVPIDPLTKKSVTDRIYYMHGNARRARRWRLFGRGSHWTPIGLEWLSRGR
jgi:hypothetical protein